MEFLPAQDVAARAGDGITYLRVRQAIQSGELQAMRIGQAYAVSVADADAWIAQERLLRDPNAIVKLQARIRELEEQVRVLKAREVA